jgi:chromosome segregation ATPase
MTTETEALEAKEAEAAFSAGFANEAPAAPAPEKEPAKVEAEKSEPETKEETAPEKIEAPAPLTADEIAALRAAAAELPTLKAQLRDASGHIGGLKSRLGELSDELKTAREQKKDEGKAPVLTAVELKRMKAEYPELAESLTADITEALSTLKREPTTSPEDITKLVSERVAEARHEDRKQALAEEHPDWEDLKKGEELWKWVATLTPEAATAFKNSSNPIYVAKQLTTFKEWRDKESKAKTASKERLEANLTPQGANRPGKSTMSDEEAMLKGFAEGFNS